MATFSQLNQMDMESYLEWVPQHAAYQRAQWKRIIWALRQLEYCEEPFEVDQLHHSLQMADRVAAEDGSDELILCALCHDVGKIAGYHNHGEISAQILKPFISHEHYCIVATHQEFECYHLGHMSPNLLARRDQYRLEPWYEAAVQFSLWDQASFDPDFATSRLEDYIPLIESLCSTPALRFA